MMRYKSGIVVFAVLLAGCSGSTTDAQIKSAQSWNATAILLGERWLNRSVPDAYSTDALKTAADELDRLSHELKASMADSSRGKRESIIVPIHLSSVRIRQMNREIETKNSPSFSVQLDSLRAAARLLELAASGDAP